MSRERNRAFMMIFGALTAVMVIFTQLFLYQAHPSAREEIKSEKTAGEPSGDQVLIAAPSDTVLSSFHSGIHHEPVLLFEILFDRLGDIGRTPKIPVSLGKYFLTLFHIIISPNAP